MSPPAHWYRGVGSFKWGIKLDGTTLNKSLYNNYLRAIRRRVKHYIQQNRLVPNSPKQNDLFQCFMNHLGIQKKPGLNRTEVLLEIYLARSLPEFVKVPRLKKKGPRRTSEEYDKYRDYIRKSKTWRKKRKEALEFYGNKCNKCGAQESLQVHHITYKSLFNENMEDLMVLCNRCHKKVHGRKKYK